MGAGVGARQNTAAAEAGGKQQDGTWGWGRESVRAEGADGAMAQSAGKIEGRGRGWEHDKTRRQRGLEASSKVAPGAGEESVRAEEG